MEARDIRNLQRAYLDVYQELDEAKQKVKIHTDKPIEYKIADIGPGKKEYNVKTSKGWADSVKEEKKSYEPDPFGRPGGKHGGVPEKGSGYDKAIQANKKAIEALDRKKANEEVDLYDAILTHLLDEGYAEDVQSAEVIMVNMSEDWREDILDEVYDADVMGRSQIRKTGEGGRVGTLRKKSDPERRRVKAVGGGKTEPVKYKERSDIGSQRQTAARVQQPTQERGSADVKARSAAAAREERIKATKARAAAKKGEAPDTQTKAKPKEVSKQATQLLSKKKETKPVSPDYTPPKASGHTTKERMSITRAGETELKGIMKKQEIEKYRDITGENPKGKALTKVLARVHKRMST